jgi:hypothetical protein
VYCSGCDAYRPPTFSPPRLVCVACGQVLLTLGPAAETLMERHGPIQAALDAIEGRMDAEGHLLDGCPTDPCFGFCDDARTAANGLRRLLQLPMIPERP